MKIWKLYLRRYQFTTFSTVAAIWTLLQLFQLFWYHSCVNFTFLQLLYNPYLLLEIPGSIGIPRLPEILHYTTHRSTHHSIHRDFMKSIIFPMKNIFWTDKKYSKENYILNGNKTYNSSKKGDYEYQMKQCTNVPIY